MVAGDITTQPKKLMKARPMSRLFGGTKLVNPDEGNQLKPYFTSLSVIEIPACESTGL